ncbi:flagellar hook assembly protein FlgD [Geobacter pelophilus]|uniref:Basal-body rod modification protein FlgD n=1 Tax=Geoanaerobacter pelophilus TaxID=60036 RepID=A0AAW4L394_9BACT|nr:flagellar hook capping FlgD N-terminal domain-containing protein [Geoanaerobacter pelophilus]MBT0663965.1 flagellar hook assembly protein FlgD [Geoanaerobacter pelophilus]
MTVNAATAVTDSASGAAAMKKATGMNKDDFLKLFITQMKNQDPLSPMDSTAFLGQLAQLTQVEQAYNTNSNLQNLIAAQNGSNNLNAVSFLGTTILAQGNQVNLAAGQQPTIAYNLASGAQKVLVEIRDSAGAVVKSVASGSTSSGDNSFVWDGKNDKGEALVAGVYSVSVSAIDAKGQQFSGTPLIQGRVDGVSLDSTTPLLTVGGVSVPLSSVLNVKKGA